MAQLWKDSVTAKEATQEESQPWKLLMARLSDFIIVSMLALRGNLSCHDLGVSFHRGAVICFRLLFSGTENGPTVG